jgi:hypothetical protein
LSSLNMKLIFILIEEIVSLSRPFFLGGKWVKKISVQLGFSSKIKVPQLGSAPCYLGSSRKIPARAHH